MKHKRTFTNATLIVLLFSMVWVACDPPKMYPPTPEIHFKEFIVTDTLDVLKNEVKLCQLIFSCIDGDWDVGLQKSDTVGPYHVDSIYYNNLFIVLYEKNDGQWNKVELEVEHNYRIPYAKAPTQNKPYKADIQVDLEYPIAFFPYDTIKYEFYIVDRAFNISNTVTTPELSLYTEIEDSGQ